MPVIADITIRSEAFDLGLILNEFPDIQIELERIVPLEQHIIPLFWIAGDDLQDVAAALRGHEYTERVKRLTATDERTLFEVHWTPDIDGVVQSLTEHRATILEATGTAEQWEFRLRFRDHDELSAFNMALTEKHIPVMLRHLYDPSIPDQQGPASPEQEETLRTAYDEGYFDVPRRKNLVEISEELDVSDSAMSQRIRRGTAALIEEHLLQDGED